MKKYEPNIGFMVLSRFSPDKNEWAAAATEIVELNYQDRDGSERRLLICDTEVGTCEPTHVVLKCQILNKGNFELSFSFDPINLGWFMQMKRLKPRWLG